VLLAVIFYILKLRMEVVNAFMVFS